MQPPKVRQTPQLPAPAPVCIIAGDNDRQKQVIASG
jgi:hypothetical protein